MKKKLKQLFAVVMAVAMVLSLSVTAGATPVNSGDLLFDNTTGSGGVVTELPKSGGIKAESRSEGPMPEDPVEVVLPTIPANQNRNDGLSANSGASFSVFDIILDPHGLINKTGGARYTVSGGSTKTFDENNRLYFLSAFDATANTQDYKGESYPLTIVNKGRQGVNVDLSLNFTYDNNAVTLVSGKDGLSMKSGDEVNEDSAGAEMYFALSIISGDEKTPTSVVDIESDDADTAPRITVSGKGDYLYGAADEDTGDFVHGVVFEWANNTPVEAVENALSGLSIKLTYIRPATIISGDDGLQLGTISGGTIWNSSPSGFSVGSGDFVVEGEDDGAVEISIKSGDAAVATISLSVMPPNPRTMKATTASGDYTQVVKFSKPRTGAVVHAAIADNLSAYNQKWADPTGTTSDPQGITSSGYYWEMDKNVKDFPTLTFQLEGDINDDDMWDLVASNTNPTDPTHPGISFELIWDVMQRSTYYESVPVLSTAGGAAVAEPSIGKPPTITNTRKATSTSRNAAITWEEGTGDYANYVPQTTVKLSNETTVDLTLSGQTLTYTGAYSAVSSGTTATVTFYDSTNTFTKTVDVVSTALR